MVSLGHRLHAGLRPGQGIRRPPGAKPGGRQSARARVAHRAGHAERLVPQVALQVWPRCGSAFLFILLLGPVPLRLVSENETVLKMNSWPTNIHSVYLIPSHRFRCEPDEPHAMDSGRKPNVGGRGLGFKASSSSSSSAGAAPPSGGHGHGGAGLSFGGGAGETSGPSGPGGGRLAAMKAAFQAQYRSQFCSSAGAAPAPTPPPPAAPTAPPPPIHRPPPPSSSSSATDRPSSRKKSRWDE